MATANNAHHVAAKGIIAPLMMSYRVEITLDPLTAKNTVVELEFEEKEGTRRSVGQLLVTDNSGVPGVAEPGAAIELRSRVWFEMGRLKYCVPRGEKSRGEFQFFAREGKVTPESVILEASKEFSLDSREGNRPPLTVLITKQERGPIEELRLTLEGLQFLRIDEWGHPSRSRGSIVLMPARNTFALSMLSSAYKNIEFADFKLVCKGQEFKCHKFLLGMASPVFKAYLTHPSKESAEGTIIIDDAEPSTVEKLVRFIYTEKILMEKDDDCSMDELSKLLQAADKYDISQLRQACIEKMKLFITSENASDVLRFARSLSYKELEADIKNYIIKKVQDVIETDSWNELIKADPTVANDIIRKMAENQGSTSSKK